MASKLTSNLSLQALAIKYDVQANGIGALQAAIDSGEILGMLQACADERFNGELKPVLQQFNRNLSSQRCTRKETDTASHNRALMVEALWTMTHSLPTAVSGQRKPRAGFQYTTKEVDDLYEAGNISELQRFYNNVFSNVSKKMAGLSTSQYAEAIAQDETLARWVAVKEYVSEKLSALKAAQKGKVQTVEVVKTVEVRPEVSEDILSKLKSSAKTKSGKVQLTREQAEALLKALQG